MIGEFTKDAFGWVLKIITSPIAVPAGIAIALMDMPLTKKGFWWNFKRVMKDNQ